jgi:hypothetical protein
VSVATDLAQSCTLLVLAIVSVRQGQEILRQGREIRDLRRAASARFPDPSWLSDQTAPDWSSAAGRSSAVFAKAAAETRDISPPETNR